MGDPRPAAARRQEARPAPPVGETAAHRRHPVPHPHRLPVAGRARALRHLADHLRAVSPLAADRRVGGDPVRPAGPGGRGRADRLGRGGGLPPPPGPRPPPPRPPPAPHPRPNPHPRAPPPPPPPPPPRGSPPTSTR